MKRTQQHRYKPRPRDTSAPTASSPSLLPTHLFSHSLLSDICVSLSLNPFFFTFSFHLVLPPSFLPPALQYFFLAISPSPPVSTLHPYYNNSVEGSWLLISLSSQMSHLCSDLNMCACSLGAELLYLSDYINEYTKDMKTRNLHPRKPCNNLVTRQWSCKLICWSSSLLFCAG